MGLPTPSPWLAGVGPFTLALGVQQALAAFGDELAGAVGRSAPLLVLGALLAGGLAGEAARLEGRLERLGEAVTRRLGGQAGFVEASCWPAGSPASACSSPSTGTAWAVRTRLRTGVRCARPVRVDQRQLADDPTSPRMAELPKIVFSKTLKPPLTWANTTVVAEPVETAVPALKAMADGTPMRTIGSFSVARSPFRLGLVDRVRVMV